MSMGDHHLVATLIKRGDRRIMHLNSIWTEGVEKVIIIMIKGRGIIIIIR